MKKSLRLLASLALVGGIFGISYAANMADLFPNGEPIGDSYTQLLNNYDAWGYSDEQSLVGCTNDPEGITITSPIVSDDYMYEILEYRLFVSPYRVDQIKSNDPIVDTSKIVMKKFKREGNSSEITFQVGVNDGLDGNTAYYAFVSPINEYDDIGTPSKEVCFHLNMNMCMMDTECDTFDAIVNPAPVEPEVNQPEENTEENTEETHGAAADCVSMKLANVSHVTNGDTITLKWTDVGEGDVDIAVFVPDEGDPSNGSYKRVGTAKMSDEKFDYKMKWEGEHNFILRNACGEVRYKADAKMGSEPEKIVPPATGPAENILYIAIAAIILYGAYTIFFRKSENN